MQIIILPEIYGRTSFITKLEAVFLKQDIPVKTLDLYEGEQPVFTDEQQAYDHFINSGGHDEYLALLQKAIQQTEGPLFILGFSVGASTVWRVLDNPDIAKRVQRFVGFYSSQIRHYLSVNPECPVTLIFPKEETHFSVRDIIDVVQRKDFVTCYQSEALHGFLNPHSNNFISELSDEFLRVFQGSYCDNWVSRLDAYLLKAFK
ncbi:dienelactone hydrolase family protein [Kiloniella sp. EL199]|uniref:dienelactone hydrolase family protein n=1 Tax=Kiloniella sp. EL199 TaxID=2107581 RepID=UPI000EA22C32|nr:dienelactone hydrolase family protein [Kiloniella sp. EL199]